ncbi:MAG: chalcone isomerase family protein [Burkholderiales bacterium]|nr:chalcone isomerase family protein [Burkholderiales bacterium]
MKLKVSVIGVFVGFTVIAARGAAVIAGAATMIMILSASLAPAMEIEGIKLDEKVSLGQGGPQVVLNGAGVRYKLALVKVYVGALYLATHKNDSEEIIKNPGAKRVAMYVLADEITAREFIASLNNALAANHIPAELALIESRIRELNRLMSTIGVLNKGGAVYLDYVPGSGTRVTVNGQEKGTIKGEDFFQSLLRIWIGKKPVDGRLRDAMLGTAAGARPQ